MFTHKVLLFGAGSSSIHYNCYSRLIAVLMNRTLGIPVPNYVDDYGDLIPVDFGAEDLKYAKILASFPDRRWKRRNPTLKTI